MGSRVRVYVKRYEVQGEVVVAACDEDVLGLRLVDQEANVVLDIDPRFYKGDLVDIEKAVEVLSNATIGNIAGENIVRIAIDRGLVHPEAVLRVKGVPVAMFTRI
ncbi:MAG: DUF424 family protein [Desulfurococcus sp.]|nr:DUF424 family protein [Desulfurococcus sp.]